MQKQKKHHSKKPKTHFAVARIPSRTWALIPAPKASWIKEAITEKDSRYFSDYRLEKVEELIMDYFLDGDDKAEDKLIDIARDFRKRKNCV